MLKIAIEIIQVAEALGYKLDKVGGISTELWKKSAQKWQPEIDKLMFERSVAYSPYTQSTLQDALKGRRLETEHLNGYIVKKGKEVGALTPINEKLVSMARDFNRGHLKPGLKHIDTLYKKPERLLKTSVLPGGRHLLHHEHPNGKPPPGLQADSCTELC